MRFTQKNFYSKEGETESELKERFSEKYENVNDYVYQESEDFPNGAALVRKDLLVKIKDASEPKEDDESDYDK